ncbi:ABC transporter permease [Mycolicibacter arupensis]|jgi:putative ABC transport system permease protein|uniref:ABC transporter permease n=1 Tax=Mycolicibacter arupensis TaxID=342002 RepID=A0A5C7Y4R6_9MYCO|nr:ABC transporter permease [Mycolicibacter arupensis]KAA1432344.1 ABC transporter permease [Mycolicibacter arupensis]TXI56566.1 MAG: ABC transporter permease [Mycolicibacter arupensis]
MLITAFRDLQWRLRRFIVAAVGTALVFALTLVLAGLTHGFRVEAEHVVDSLHIDRYLIQTAAVGPFMGSSRFPQAEAGDIAGIAGVQAALPVVYGNTIVHDGSSPLNVNIYGVPKAAMPPLSAGRAPTEPNEIAMSTTLHRAVGDEVELGAAKLRIVGLVDKSTTLAGQPNGFLTVAGAQRLMYSGQPVVSAIGLRGVPARVPQGYRVVDRVAAVDDMVRPLAGAQMALSYMSVLLWAVAALIVGSLIYLSALERTRDFAVFKALGVTTSMVLTGLALQAVVVAVTAAVLGGVLAVSLGPLFPMLVAVTGSSFALLVLTAVGIGLLASLAGLRHAVSVDPVLAFGGP